MRQVLTRLIYSYDIRLAKPRGRDIASAQEPAASSAMARVILTDDYDFIIHNLYKMKESDRSQDIVTTVTDFKSRMSALASRVSIEAKTN